MILNTIHKKLKFGLLARWNIPILTNLSHNENQSELHCGLSWYESVTISLCFIYFTKLDFILPQSKYIGSPLFWYILSILELFTPTLFMGLLICPLQTLAILLNLLNYRYLSYLFRSAWPGEKDLHHSKEFY